MPDDLCRILVESFLKSSWPCVKTIVDKLASFKEEKVGRNVSFFRFKSDQRIYKTFDGSHFFLRGSVEYSNPQLTVEELQGIIGARMLEVCGNYFSDCGLHQPDNNDVAQVCEALKEPPKGSIVAFLLNTDDVEPDRYSMNPLKSSLMTSGQSAYPAAYVKTESLAVDPQFVDKYEGTLISRGEARLVSNYLQSAKSSYLDFVDSVKYAQLDNLSEVFGMDLSLYSLRMPLATLQAETKDGLLHHIISQTHRGFDTVKQAYDCMGRSITKRTTLLTIPHSQRGYGSKRAARGKLHFNETKLASITVRYQPTKLYPNAIDPEDVSIAHAEDNFELIAERLADYSFAETPSSPQFSLYSLGSPEDAAVWHGVGAFAAPQLLQSYASVRNACMRGQLIEDLHGKYGVKVAVPLQFNLAVNGMWVHPVHRNIDASLGCVGNPADLARMGMQLEYLSAFK
jgi:hypothetical protein